MIKISSLFPVFWLSISFASVRAAPTKTLTVLPAAVRAETPQGIVTAALFQLAPAPGDRPFLFHLWTAPRRDPAGGGGFGVAAGYYKGRIGKEEVNAGGLRASPFVLDIFSVGQKPGQWHYEASLITRETRAPQNYTLRYLDARKKQGYVITTSAAIYHSREVNVHVFPGEFPFERAPVSHTFYGHSYMDSTGYSFPRDPSGVLQVMRHEINVGNTLDKRTTFVWAEDEAAEGGEAGWKISGEPVTVPVMPAK